MKEGQIQKILENADKAGRGPNIPEEWKNYIIHQALWESHVPRLLLADKILEDMKRSSDYTQKPLPEKESIAKLISTWRNLPVTDEDEPWSVAASVTKGLPPEATKDLFDIWRASLALDRPISIRQAKWLVYIRNLFYQRFSTGNTYSDKVNRNLWLIRQSWLYSILERASRIMGGKSFDTINIDAASFMPPWEHVTALELGKVSPINYSQEALAKLEKHGTSLTSPPVSVKSIEEAVWRDVRSEPPQQLEFMADYMAPDDILPEEDDLVAAYWLRHLSKGPLWNKLPEQPDIKALLEYFEHEQRQLRAQYEKAEAEGRPFLWADSGGGPDDSLYSRQLSVRDRVLEWVKAKRDYYPVVIGSLKGLPFVFNAMLLKTVGYEVTPEGMELWFDLRKRQLKAQHKGYDQLPPDIQKRFIHHEQTPYDKKALESADDQVVLKQKQREAEFIELIQQKGGPPTPGTGHKETESFWTLIRDEWVKRYPKLTKRGWEHLQPENCELEYERLKAKLAKEAQNERSHRQEG